MPTTATINILLTILTLTSHLPNRDAAAWVGQQRDLIEAHESGAPQFRQGLWRAFYNPDRTPSYAALFKPQKEDTWAYTLPGTLEIVTERALSKSYIAILGEKEREEVVAEIRNIIGRGDGRVWRDEGKGEFEYPYKTTVVISEKKA